MKKTSLHDTHVRLGARMVDFAGWQMPVQYGSIVEEASCVRQRSGLFDLGHMGRFLVRGPDAVALVDRVITNHCAKIPVGSIRYALFLDEKGCAIDDLLVYRDEQDVYLVVNASNCERDLAWIREHIGELNAEVDDLTDATAMLALQGPASQEVLQAVVEDCDLGEIKYYRFAFGTVCGMPNIRISRTGYTGENGFEIYFPTEEGERVWEAITAAGLPHGLAPIGLAARDTLRLEAGMALYGHEIDQEHDPLEAGLDFAVALTEAKGDFIGRAALEARHAAPTRKLVGLNSPGPRIPRQGYVIMAGDEEVGVVCSGALSPTLDTQIATAFVKLGHDSPGTKLEFAIRGKRQPCTIQELPFYSRTRKKN